MVNTSADVTTILPPALLVVKDWNLFIFVGVSVLLHFVMERRAQIRFATHCTICEPFKAHWYLYVPLSNSAFCPQTVYTVFVWFSV
jgi:hypothetical protein